MDLETALGLLELPRDFDPSQVKQQYRQRAKSCHPDLCPGDGAATQQFQALSLAYVYLLRQLEPSNQPDHQPSTAVERPANPETGFARPTDPATASGPLNQQERLLRDKHLEQIKGMVRAGKLLQAIAAIDALIQRLPQDPSLKPRKGWIYYGHARLLLRQGHFVQANKYLKAALKLAPGDRSLWHRVEEIYANLAEQQPPD